MSRFIPLACLVALVLTTRTLAEGQYHVVNYPSAKPGEGLQMSVTYTLWVPPNVKTLRGIIVHQHGCGVGACKGGETSAYDLHWQALAKKWDCALLGPSYHQDAKQNCRLWCDPRNGSAKTFLQSLGDLAKKAKHPEIEDVPWCLWGHSGGGFWSSLMQTIYPDRILAIWLRSGTAFRYWSRDEIKKPVIPEGAYDIPVMCNPGAKERDHKRFKGAWSGTFSMFQAYRKKGAPIGFAPDPRTAHECGDSRYLAIPFFDACLEMRLPKEKGKMRPVNQDVAWYAEPLSQKAMPGSKLTGEKRQSLVWLPNEKVAKAWEEYVKKGSTSDSTPPPAPFNVRVSSQKDGTFRVTWDARADFESGLQKFIVLRDGKELGTAPVKPAGRFGRPLFQSMSYHDTPEAPLPKMEFIDTSGKRGMIAKWQVIAVNSVGLKSKPGTAQMK